MVKDWLYSTQIYSTPKDERGAPRTAFTEILRIERVWHSEHFGDNVTAKIQTLIADTLGPARRYLWVLS